MQPLTELQPRIREAHYYEFPKALNDFESTRFGYCYAFHLIAGGKGRIKLGGRSFTVHKGDLLYFRLISSIPSSRMPISRSAVIISIASYGCRFLPPPIVISFGTPGISTLRSLTAIKHDPAVAGLPHYLPLQHHETLAGIFQHIVMHHQSTAPLSGQIAEGLLKAMILEIMQLSEVPLLTDYRIKPIMALMDQETKVGRHFETWLTLSGLKKTQFHHLFKQATGLSPKAYWTRAIMKQAAASLKESNRTITDIAMT